MSAELKQQLREAVRERQQFYRERQEAYKLLMKIKANKVIYEDEIDSLLKNKIVID